MHSTFRNITGTAAMVTISAFLMMNPNTTVSLPHNSHETAKIYKHGHYLGMPNNGVNVKDYTNIYLLNKKSNIEKEAYNLFGNMRDLTEDEERNIDNYIESISKETGVNFFDLC